MIPTLALEGEGSTILLAALPGYTVIKVGRFFKIYLGV
jgi:hypothetical protein